MAKYMFVALFVLVSVMLAVSLPLEEEQVRQINGEDPIDEKADESTLSKKTKRGIYGSYGGHGHGYGFYYPHYSYSYIPIYKSYGHGYGHGYYPYYSGYHGYGHGHYW